ncbi:MAG: energy transducer TonB [Bacteroidales bacterium]|nr:energy transducer TonB [Bacteroidales bacterium]
MKSRILFTCVFIIIASIVSSQIVNNLRFEQSGKMIDVYYDLSGKGDDSFLVKLYCSQDGGKTWGAPLKYVSGAIGESVKPGNGKKISWDVLKEKDKLVGEVKFKVEASHKFNIEEEVGEAEIFTMVEESPSFPGGDEARIRFLTENINYPQIARESSIHGTVYVTFVVERNGNVTDVRVLRGIGGGCDEEAIRVIKAMPKWSPGKQRGKPVRVQFNMPIKFTLVGK